MKKQVMAVAALCALMSGAAFAQEAEGPWLVRARAVNLQASNGDTTGLGLSTNNKWLPEVDFTYFINKNIAAELILTVPQSQTLYSNGTAIGSFKHLPPTLTLQYHFDLNGFKPYVGAGINYTRLSSINLPAGVSAAGSKLGTFKVDPLLVGVGLGWRF